MEVCILKKQPFCNFTLAGVSITDFGLEMPSPFASLELSNSEIQSMTSWTLNCIVGGDASRKMNIAAFEALLYSAAQSAAQYPDSSGIPVSFIFGWLDEFGNVAECLSYQGFTIKFSVSTTGVYMNYKITGYASLAVQTSMPVLRIPAVSGFVQPSAIVVALAESVKATSYYELDIDRNDTPTLVNHGPITTSFNKYVRGEFSADDEYSEFPGLLPLSKTYSSAQNAAGLIYDFHGVRKLSQVVNNATDHVSDYLRRSNVDTTPQCASFSYWVDEPTMTRPGIIHYKSNANIMSSQNNDVLEYGTENANVLSISGSYDGVAYNMSDMNFRQVGFAVDGSGNTITQDAQVVNSWSSSLSDVFQSASIINDVNALASQFSGDFTVQIPGSVKSYTVAQPVSLIVYSGGTLSPITGIYNIVSVTHNVSNLFVTTLKLQRLVISNANQTAAAQGIFVSGSSNYNRSSYDTTNNIITPYMVKFGDLYPNFEHMSTQ